MASKELRGRENWQTESGKKALSAEEVFANELQNALNEKYPNTFIIDRHPIEFSDIYSTFEVSEDTAKEIYNIDVKQKKSNGKPLYSWGISMDFAIRNKLNGKTLFGEIKRQDGWVEDKDMSAGRGNAHERSCKYFTPGLLSIIREASKVSEEILPFWVVLIGDITRDPRRNREIAFWYNGYSKNYFMWREYPDSEKLITFFETNLLKYLLK